jgi:hypothetical protein
MIEKGQGPRDDVPYNPFSRLIDYHLLRLSVQKKVSGTTHTGIQPTKWSQVDSLFALVQEGGLANIEPFCAK